MSAFCLHRNTGGEPCSFQCHGCAQAERYERMVTKEARLSEAKGEDDDLYPEKESE